MTPYYEQMIFSFESDETANGKTLFFHSLFRFVTKAAKSNLISFTFPVRLHTYVHICLFNSLILQSLHVFQVIFRKRKKLQVILQNSLLGLICIKVSLLVGLWKCVFICSLDPAAFVCLCFNSTFRKIDLLFSAFSFSDSHNLKAGYLEM